MNRVFALTCTFVLTQALLHASVCFAADQAAYTQCVTAATSGHANVDEALAACAGPAAEGTTGAMYALGVLHLKKPTGRADAVRWLTSAAKSGHPAAAFELAKLSLDTATTGDDDESLRWLRFAACSGYKKAEDLARTRGVSTTLAECPARALRDFAGIWTGELTSVKSADDKRSLRLSITPSGVDVFMLADGEWIKVKPGKFATTEGGASLLVTAVDSGWDLDGQWFESWSFAILRLSEREAFASFTRTVNNVNMPATLDWRFFTSIAEGRLSRGH